MPVFVFKCVILQHPVQNLWVIWYYSQIKKLIPGEVKIADHMATKIANG